MTRFGGTRALTALLIALLLPLGTAQRASALDAPNGAPDIGLPDDVAIDEDSPYNFVGDAITLTDPDAGTDDVRLDLSVTSGVLHVAVPDGLTFVDDTTNDTDALKMTGSLSAFDAALDTLQFMPAQDDTETVTLTALADDLGHNGDDGPQTDLDTMDITVNPVNDAPVVTVPGTQSIAEGNVAVFSAATSNVVSVGDVDAAGSDVQLTLAGTSGTATLATTNGLTFSAGDGDHDATMTFTGTLTALNAALDGMTFTPDASFVGSASLSVDADDQGNTGSGGSATDHKAVTIDVTPVVNPPAPRLRLAATSVAVSSSGHLVVPVSCANAVCAGTLELRTGGSALGSGTISVAAGGSGAVAIDLTAAGRALVSSRPSADVTTVMAVTGASTTASVLTLTAARAPSVKLLTGKAHVRASKAKVKLSCGADGPCAATYVLTTTIGDQAKALATVQVGLAAGQTKTVKLKLSKAVKKALRKGAVTATQTVTSDIAVGLDTTTTRPLKLVT